MRREQVVDQGYGEFFLISINAAGIAIFPVVGLGYSLYVAAGMLGALVTAILCCTILYVVASSIMKIAISYRVNSMEIAAEYFGRRGSPVCSIVIGAAFCEWFIWQINNFVYFVKYVAFAHLPFLYSFSQTQIGFFCVTLFLITAVSGTFGLRFLLFVLVPLLFVTAFVVIIIFLKDIPMVHQNLIRSEGLSLSTVSVFLSSFAAHTFSTPTFYRFASSPSVASRSLKKVYFGILPLFLGIGVLIAFLSPHQDVYEIFESMRGWWPVFFVFYSFLGCWTVCVLNLYYGADAFAHVFSLGENRSVILLMGLICTGIICFDMFSMQVTKVFGTMTIGVVTIIMTRAAMSGMFLRQDNKRVQMGNCVALICSNIAVFATTRGYVEITGIPFFDSMLVAFCVCAYFSIFKHPKRFPFLHDA